MGTGVPFWDLDGGDGPLEGSFDGALSASVEWDRSSFSRFISGLEGFAGLLLPQCWASRDLLSSIGVKILRDLEGLGILWSSGIC